jgi:hypothetical protein
MKKNYTRDKKAMTIYLIKQDLLNTRIIMGFLAMGIEANDYTTDLSEFIFMLVGVDPEHRQIEEIFKHYMTMIRKVIHLNILIQKNEFDEMANDIYNFLVKVRKGEFYQILGPENT